MTIIKHECKDFLIACGNGDSECFANDEVESDVLILRDRSICDICVYNQKHDHYDYSGWQEYRKEIGIPPK